MLSNIHSTNLLFYKKVMSLSGIKLSDECSHHFNPWFTNPPPPSRTFELDNEDDPQEIEKENENLVVGSPIEPSLEIIHNTPNNSHLNENDSHNNNWPSLQSLGYPFV